MRGLRGQENYSQVQRCFGCVSSSLLINRPPVVHLSTAMAPIPRGVQNCSKRVNACQMAEKRANKSKVLDLYLMALGSSSSLADKRS